MYDDNVEPQYFTIVKSALLTNDVTPCPCMVCSVIQILSDLR